MLLASIPDLATWIAVMSPACWRCMTTCGTACDRFYEALKRSTLPLVSHGGYEHRVLNSSKQAELNNPLALRRALTHGIRVIISHAASTGENMDTDHGADGPIVQSFTLFTRMMIEPRYEGLLYGDISALTEPSRTAALLKSVLLNDAWQGQLT